MKQGFKRFAVLLTAALLLFTSACKQATHEKNGKLRVLCTVFPLYDWAREIAGDRADIIWLVSNGTDMHSYQPTADDMIKISTCDVLLYVGGESDSWIDDLLRTDKNEERRVIDLLSVLGESAKSEEHTEGMEQGEEHSETGDEYDEHVWLSLKNAALFTHEIAAVLDEADKENASYYLENAAQYGEQLAALDAAYTKAAEESDKHTLVFADRFPFRYLTDDYHLKYYAAFPGCSAETEASFQTVAFLSQKADEEGLNAILTTESAVPKLAETVIKNTERKNQEILVLDSMQSVTAAQSDSGVTYLSVMGKNLEVLKKALD